VEIGHYLEIVRRKWWVVALTTLAALLVAVLLAYRGAAAYKSTVRLSVSVPVPEDCTGRAAPSLNSQPARFYDCNYYAWLTSEYLADDMSEIVKSQAFAEDVSAAMGERLDPRAISDVLRTRKTHRILTMTVTANERARAQRIGEAMVQVISTQGGKYLAPLAEQSAQVVVIDPPQTDRGDGPAAVALEIGLKTLLGLLFGLALVFALDLLDPTIRDTREAERTLGLPILGEIPAPTASRRRVATPSG
jgi:capsular polysaccharide biosynthesis protein